MKTRTRLIGSATAALLVVAGLAGCATATSDSTAPGAAASGAPAAPPGGGGGATATVTPLGAWTVSSGNASSTGKSYIASAANTSGILVTGGSLTLADAGVTTSGASSSSDESSFYGLDAGILVQNATLAMTGGSVSTTGDGANGIFAYGSARATLTGVAVNATGRYAHGIMASGGGTITATGVTASTTSSNGAVIATDRGGGTIVVKGGSYSTAGTDSPGIYSTGTITVTGATVRATGAEAAVIEGSNSISLTDTTISGGAKSGVMLYQSMSGDASGSESRYTQTGGSLSAAAGPLLYVTNATGEVTLSGVKVTAAGGVLAKAAADKWGTSGSNGGNLVLNATDETLSGDVVVDGVSTAVVKLTGTSWTGVFDGGGTARSSSLTLSGGSTWTVTADSHVGTLSGVVLSGSTVTNIAGNGHTVHYRASSNPDLGGRTYTLTGGGSLVPAS